MINKTFLPSISSFGLKIARGKVPGFTADIINGQNLNIGRIAREDIWDNGGVYPFQSVAFTPVASSTNTNDDLTGTGARTITIRGINALGNEIFTAVDLDGTNEVTFPDAILHINEVLVTAVGNTGFNEGDITVLTQSAGTVVAKIIEQINVTLSSIRIVPNGQVYYITSLFTSLVPQFDGTGLKEGELIFQTTEPNLFRTQAMGVSVFITRFSTTISKTGSSNFFHIFTATPKITAGQKIRLQFIAHQNNTKVVAGYEVFIEDVA